MIELPAPEPEHPSPWLIGVTRLRTARHARPFTITFSVLLPIPATMAIILGDQVSAALTNLGAGVYGRVLGIMLLSGCLITLHAIATRRALQECMGMVLTSMGSYLYGFGVIVGLMPFGGVVAGTGFIGIGTGFLLSMFSLTTLARLNVQGGESGDER